MLLSHFVAIFLLEKVTLLLYTLLILRSSLFLNFKKVGPSSKVGPAMACVLRNWRGYSTVLVVPKVRARETHSDTLMTGGSDRGLFFIPKISKLQNLSTQKLPTFLAMYPNKSYTKSKLH